MTNSYDVAHGLSQDEPGPLEPVEIAQQDDTLARTGNTARDQEMYAAGIRTGEENAKHNAAIRAGAGWLPIESAPKDGTEIWAYNGEQARMRWVEGECYALWIWADDLLADADPSPEQPTYWQTVPAAPGVSTVEAHREYGSPARILRQFLTVDGFIAECDIPEICARLRPAPAAGDALDAVDVDWQLLRETAMLVRDRFSAALSIAYASSDATRSAIRRAHETHEALLAMLDAAIAAQRKGDA
ncbi:hypothetical protein NAT65_25830 [Achromobacter xylosoxidans]|uniref:hypothetical protein n=1 Tax=Alcaligenes xylosoxydans xylosoxydans TaxID=85698 RepID=UPI00203A43D5|nr:hypothetical protein [Achromobacter xylosoxidans]MCM2574521.1 hypothetical protein [Achromobacter xylosoxidans]